MKTKLWWKLGLVILAVLVVILWEVLPFLQLSKEKLNMQTNLEKTIPKLMEKYDVPGVAVAWIKEGKIAWMQGYGWADVKKHIPITKDTLFQVASNSKTVTAWAVMHLVEQGKLELDKPIEQYLSRWKFSPGRFDAKEVTIRRILSHTAGLSQRGYAGYPPGSSLPTLEQSLSGKIKGVNQLKIIKKPGKKYKYSGGGYTLLQLVVEEVTGQPFAEYMQKEVLQPLNMSNSSFTWQPEMKDKVAKSYDIFSKPLPNYLFTEQAAAGLYTTVEDLAHFLESNIQIYQGKNEASPIVTTKTLKQMMTPVKKDYGFAYLIDKLPGKDILAYHGGANRGWRSQFGILPKQKEGIVILTNSDNGEGLYTDLLSLWTYWEKGVWPDIYGDAIMERVEMKLIALLLAVLFTIGTSRIVKKILQGEKRFIFRKSKKRGGERLKHFGFIILAIVLPIAWWLVFYTDSFFGGWVAASMMPFGFAWIMVMVVVWSVYFLLRGLFMKADTKEK